MTRAREPADGRGADHGAAFRRGRRAGLHPVPAPEGAPAPARRHAVGRRAADAGDRPRADGRPRLLLLDEPSLGLAPDPGASRSSRRSSRSTATEGVTILLVEQNAYQALKLAHRGYVLATGRVRARGHRRASCWPTRRSAPPISKAGTEHGRADRRCSAPRSASSSA